MVTNTHERRLWWRHLLSVLVAPITMTLVIPALIVSSANVRTPDLSSPAFIALATVGVVLIAVGLALMVWTNVLFHRIGKGTLGVGPVLGEPVHLVVRGPYRHVRNPMITGVLCVLLGEAVATASGWLLGWFAIFFTAMAIVIRFWEEPHLVQRYGAEYVEYRRNVPRWVPRISPWG
jgi:protein-S-isoprenylcysteine O-methyltransferase Ste14